MQTIIHALTYISGLMAVAFALCAAVGHLAGDSSEPVLLFLKLGGFWLLVSVAAWFITRHGEEINRRQAFLLVVAGWVLSSLIGSLPYLLLGATPDFISSLFESMSGLTTTGATVLSELEKMPRSLLFWRSLTHFFGGVGILIMFIAILPFVGVGGFQVFKAESTGMFLAKLTPRIAATARIILSIYLLLNLLCFIALLLGGLSPFDAVCHSFSAISTGGFSTRSDSIAAFNSPYVEWVLVVFMFVSASSFILHYQALRGNFAAYRRSSEWRFYALVCLVVPILFSFSIPDPAGAGYLPRLRQAAFQTISLLTTTGFTTADYNYWPLATRLILLLLMMAGASAGSTTGAIKCIRLVVAGKAIKLRLLSLVQPSRVQTVKIDGATVSPETVGNALVYIATYLLLVAAGSVLMACLVPDPMTSVSAVIASLGCIGPGMNQAGPVAIYADFPAPAKLLLTVLMWLGRLEIFVCLAVLAPSFWKRPPRVSRETSF